MPNLTVAPILHALPVRQRAWKRVVTYHWPILFIAAAFMVLGVRYSVTTPLFEAPNEPAHYRQVLLTAHGDEAPMPLSPELFGQEALRQPPLYYAIGALLTRDIDMAWSTMASDRPLFGANPHAALGMVHAPANKNAVIHLEGDGYTYHGVSLAVRVLRWFSVLSSTVTVGLAYLIALQILPGRRALATGVASLAAFNPQFLFISGSASNDSLATLWATAALYLAVRLTHDVEHSDRLAALLGLCVGLAALTRVGALSALFLIPVAGLARARSWQARRLLAETLRPVGIALGVALVVCGWWYGGRLFIPDDAARHGNLVGLQRAAAGEDALRLAELPSIIESLVLSFWGVFGWMNVPAGEVFYSLVRILTMLGVLGVIPALAWVYWRRRTFRPYRWRAALVLGAWPLIVLGSLAVGAMLWSAPTVRTVEGRFLFPAIASITFFLFIGISAWFPRRYVGAIGLALVGGMAVIAAQAPAWYIAPAYAAPPRIALEEVPDRIHNLHISYGDELFLVGYELPQENVRAGETLRLRLYWLARRAMDSNYTVYVHVTGRGGECIGRIDTYPGGGNLPTRRWLPGDVVVDEYAVPITPDALGPAAAIIRVGVYGGENHDPLPALDARLRPIEGSAEIARVRVAPAQAPRFEPENRLAVNLGHRMVLTGYGLSSTAPHSGGSLVVDLYWKPLARLTHDYTVFVHLIDEEGNLRGQIDQQPVQGDYPTSLWIAEEVVRDTHTLLLPTDLPAGRYLLNVGLYLVETGERLEVIDANPPQSAVTLGPIEIAGR